MNNTSSSTKNTNRINWKKLLGAAMLGAFACAPIVSGSTPAQADPPPWSNSRNNRDGNRDRKDRDRRDRRDNRNQTYRENRTYEGVVTNDQPGREFVVRMDNGQRVQVRSEEREPRRLSKGDRVRVQGYFLRTGERDRNNTRYNDNVLFRATNVQVIRNRNNNDRYDNNRYGNNGGVFGNNNRRNMSGVVTDVRGDRSLRVRIDGRDYDVESSSRLNSNINRGTRVRVNGEMRGNDIRNAMVFAEDNRYDYGRNDYGRNNGYYGNNDKFEFSGRVSDVDKDDRTLRVRGDNGRDYSLRVNDRDELDGVRRGDRVRVRGQVRNGTTIVDDVDKI